VVRADISVVRLGVLAGIQPALSSSIPLPNNSFCFFMFRELTATHYD